MTGLNFLPLVLWALGFMALGIWDDHLRQIDGRGKAAQIDGDAFADIYMCGCASFFLVGAVFSL
ncbi:MAG: hypothetical protein A2075_09270 [Geobacteraceae bacterium GWC2_58_44]|nr:MAG: hypothetical protein A2075_09270 [Geobacteraceae bacterium GWC2_58_44]HBG07703.1 hypothetical protein [Geobacter sp.]